MGDKRFLPPRRGVRQGLRPKEQIPSLPIAFWPLGAGKWRGAGVYEEAKRGGSEAAEGGAEDEIAGALTGQSKGNFHENRH